MNKQTIEVLKSKKNESDLKLKTLESSPLKNLTAHSQEEKKYNEALSQAIQWGEALQSAEGELPDIARLLENRSLVGGKAKEKVADQILDLIKPILAKKELRIEEIIKQIFEWEKANNIVSICSRHRIPEASCSICNSGIRELQQELATLKAKIRELEGDIVEGGMKYDDEVINVAFLKAELEKAIKWGDELTDKNNKLTAPTEKAMDKIYNKWQKENEQLQSENVKLRELLSEERIEQILSTPNFDIIFVNDKLKKHLARVIAKGKE